ncbi:uncharacterized protein DS421_18g608320 [Arachis hypogaea]|nr:uncharacterized protein DS421_18g608320 [Arachis hypogaea]
MRCRSLFIIAFFTSPAGNLYVARTSRSITAHGKQQNTAAHSAVAPPATSLVRRRILVGLGGIGGGGGTLLRFAGIPFSFFFVPIEATERRRKRERKKKRRRETKRRKPVTEGETEFLSPAGIHSGLFF